MLSKYGAAGDVVVTCAATGRQEAFALDDVVGYDLMSYYYYGTKQETDFDAESLLTSAIDGVLTDALRCCQDQPFLFFPEVNAASAAEGLSGDTTVLVYASRGMTVGDSVQDTVTVQSILDTSQGGLAVTADGSQTPGVYSVAASASEELEDGLTARLTVFGSMTAAEPPISADSLRNTDLFLGALTCGFDEISNLSSQPVSLEEPRNTVATGGLWALLFIFVIPLAAVAAGFARWTKRRKL